MDISEHEVAKMIHPALEGKLLYVAPSKSWWVCDGTFWHIDETEKAVGLISDALSASGLVRANYRTVKNIMSFLKSMVPALSSDFDADPGVMATGDGELLDLVRGGESRAVEPHDMISKSTKPIKHAEMVALEEQGVYHANSDWEMLLDNLAPDHDTRKFLQMAVGMSLVGNVHDHGFILLRGDGGNGKSTFVNAVRGALDDYAVVAPRTLLTRMRVNDAAELWGARFVVCEELDSGRINTAALKMLTGGDPLKSRRLYGQYETVDPTHTLWIVCQELPDLGDDVSEGIWRRAWVIETGPTVPKIDRDPELPHRLMEPDCQAHILHWAVEGLRMWHAAGRELEPSVIMRGTVDRWRKATTDPLLVWADEWLDFSDPHAFASSRELAGSLSAYYGRTYKVTPTLVGRWMAKDGRAQPDRMWIQDGQKLVAGWRGVRVRPMVALPL